MIVLIPYQFIKSFLENKMSVFEGYGAFNIIIMNLCQNVKIALFISRSGSLSAIYTQVSHAGLSRTSCFIIEYFPQKQAFNIFNVKACFLGKNRKHRNLLSAKLAQRVVNVRRVLCFSCGLHYIFTEPALLMLNSADPDLWSTVSDLHSVLFVKVHFIGQFGHI